MGLSNVICQSPHLHRQMSNQCNNWLRGGWLEDCQYTLRVRLHHLANHSNDEAVENLCRELNETNTLFPGTNLRMIF